MTDRIEVYEDAAGEFRWRLVAENGEVLGDSGEGYVNRTDALHIVATRFPGVEISEEE